LEGFRIVVNFKGWREFIPTGGVTVAVECEDVFFFNFVLVLHVGLI
jgi:hypothetical protein